MSVLSFLRDERVVFASLGLATLSFIGTMRMILEYYRDEAEIKPVQPKTQYITQDTEDALEISTLQTLLGHYSFSIRDTALKIAAGRAVNDSSVIDYLLWGITREDYEERMKCLRTLVFAVEDKSAQDPLVVINTPKGYSALVRSLELSLDDFEHEKLDDPLYDEYYLRDIGERRCIMLVCQLIYKYGPDKLVQAKFVAKWLAKQKWGDTDEERRKNFTHYVERKKNRISDICTRLQASKAGRKALRQAKLLGRGSHRPRERSRNRIKVILEISMANEDENGEIQHESFQTELVPRVVEQSAEEQRRRRRHREAIVLNDGTHSLGRGDIIEREHDTNS
ncbi:uncharacterized protein BCR38DRAFT_350615 [Pseudomassariella vexata]|uniref:Cytoskeleton-associated protein n=1 Tax=Pseudomassariella vexata TaxID=1141098 RepID=A0A1Y2DLN7_9PEZI|nr:uncharacterized protein BCR38DRAFT_350615 [Pseudomassariella vexata]ORY60180.1 hypothetical protein BCR38DRAFT_350615 [Pseudomassariella vexata]